jgi:hypothetical protein
MILYDGIIQGSPEWHELRELKLTGSKASAIATAGKGLESLVKKLILQKITGKSDDYTNEHMERGNRLEPLARTKFQLEYPKCNLVEIGFVEYTPYSGVSPDGLIFDRDMKKLISGIEIKCRGDDKHFDLLMGAPIDSATLWQIQMNILVCDVDHWHHIAFNPNFNNSMYLTIVDRDPVMQEKLMKGIQKGTQMIQDALSEDIVQDELGWARINAVMEQD